MRQRKIWGVWSGTAAMLIVAASVWGEEAAPATPAKAETPVEVPGTVVTATRLATDPELVGSSLTVIDSQQLESSRVRTVYEALQTVPGMTVAQSGGPGGTASVFIRGHNSNQTKVLIDSVRVNSNTTGGYDFSNLTVGDIERIEVVRGPQSALYGSDAMGGVVNIITRRGQQGLHGSASVAAGNKGAMQDQLNLNGGNQTADFNLNYGYSRFDGSSIAAENLGNREDDKWVDRAGSGRFGLNFLGDGRADLTLRYAENVADQDSQSWTTGLPIDDLDYQQHRRSLGGNLTVSKPITEWYSQTFTYGVAREDLRGSDPTDAANEFTIENQTTDIGLKSDFFVLKDSPVEDTVTLGYDYERQAGRNDAQGLDQTLDINSVYAQNYLTYTKNFSLTTGVRNDRHEMFGDETTYRVAASIRQPDLLTRLHGSYGTGFRAPTINDLYWPVSAWSYGNPDLQPETSKSYDVGVEQPLLGKFATLDVTYFESRVEDLIQWAETAPGSWVYTPQNVANAQIDGIETSLTLRPHEQLDLTGSYTYENTEDGDTGKELARRPVNRFALRADYRITSRTRVNMTVTRAGASFEDAANTRRLDPWTRVDLGASHDLTAHVQLFGRVENLFDVEYHEAHGYDTAGLVMIGGVKCSF